MGVTTSHGTTQKLEEVARTVYVGNINPTTTPEELMNFFGVCGPITFLRMAGDDVHTNRFAFIEFATLVSVCFLFVIAPSLSLSLSYSNSFSLFLYNRKLLPKR
jgi:hypothetical protein